MGKRGRDHTPGEVRSISPSSYSLLLDCERKWFYKYVDPNAPPQPEHPAAVLGTHIHTAIEHHLQGLEYAEDEPVKSQAAARVRAAVRSGSLAACRPPAGTDMILEARVTRDLEPFGGIGKLAGYADLVWTAPNPAVIDHKSKGDLRFLLTEEELRNDPQLLAYAGAAHPDAPSVRVAHHYLPPDPHQPHLVWAVATKEAIEHTYSLFAGASRRMAELRRESAATMIPPNTGACEKYGGCPYGAVCPAAPAWVAAKYSPEPVNPVEEYVVSEPTPAQIALRARIAALRGGTAPAPAPEPAPAPVETPAPAPAAVARERINPPDAAPPYSAEDPAPNPANDDALLLYTALIEADEDALPESRAKTHFRTAAEVKSIAAPRWKALVEAGARLGYWQYEPASKVEFTVFSGDGFDPGDTTVCSPEPAVWGLRTDPAMVDAVETVEEHIEEVAPPPAARAAAAPTRWVANAPVVYIGCLPAPGPFSPPVVSVDEWLADYFDKHTTDERGAECGHYLLVPFNKGPLGVTAHVAIDLRNGALLLPPALYIPRDHPLASSLPGVLARYCVIVRASS